MSGPVAGHADEPVRLSRTRRAVARAMTASALVPQFTVERTVAAEPALALRERLKRDGSAATLSDLLTAACAHALVEHPDVNASFRPDEDAVQRHRAINVGLAVALEDGLVVPCVHDADRLSLAALAAERQRLQAAAHDGALTPPDVLDTTFTISNLAPLGVDRFRALVNLPQAAILAVGAVGAGAVAGPDGALRLARVMQLSLSCDHRALDGAPAARFLATLVRRLESPDWMEAL